MQIAPAPIEQIVLFHEYHEDDLLLLNSEDAQWYRILANFPWRDYQELAAKYYDALYHYNQSLQASNSSGKNDESKQDATQRLLFSRPTVDDSLPVLYAPDFKKIAIPRVSPHCVAPGLIPHREGGRKPKCFFAMFKSFLGASLMGFAAEPENVHDLLRTNISFARVCGFIPAKASNTYWHMHIPSLRKLEQFDLIMREYGLWNQEKWDEVRKNIALKVIEKESTLVGDTTHYHARSGFRTIAYKDEKGGENKKSQSKTTKNCRCKDKDSCSHPWILADDGAGTIVKGKGSKKMYWGHKAAIIGLPQKGIPLDAKCVADAATHDRQTFLPHVIDLFKNLPEIKSWIENALYDSACDDQKLKDQFQNELGIGLKTSLNPRRRQTITDGLPQGMAKLTPYAGLFCNGGFEMQYKGMRHDQEKFIYQAPADENGSSVCLGCEHRHSCCPLSAKGRVVTIQFDMLPHIDPQDPPMAKRFKALMTRRPAVERMIKRLKCDLGDDRLTKRGNASFQAYLDKTMIAFHILLRT